MIIDVDYHLSGIRINSVMGLVLYTVYSSDWPQTANRVILTVIFEK